jgi:hypothetical protein
MVQFQQRQPQISANAIVAVHKEVIAGKSISNILVDV